MPLLTTFKILGTLNEECLVGIATTDTKMKELDVQENVSYYQNIPQRKN
jgi:hypothetical protein